MLFESTIARVFYTSFVTRFRFARSFGLSEGFRCTSAGFTSLWVAEYPQFSTGGINALDEFKRIFNTIKEKTRIKSVGSQVLRPLLLRLLEDGRQ